MMWPIQDIFESQVGGWGMESKVFRHTISIFCLSEYLQSEDRREGGGQQTLRQCSASARSVPCLSHKGWPQRRQRHGRRGAGAGHTSAGAAAVNQWAFSHFLCRNDCHQLQAGLGWWGSAGPPCAVELQTNLRKDYTITEKVPYQCLLLVQRLLC